MRPLLYLLLLLMPALHAATPVPPPTSVPAHAHHHAPAHASVPEDGRRWAADAPLRTAMQQIRSARARPVGSAAEAVALADAVDAAIAYMVRNCALPPEADAALHGVIGELGGASSRLRREPDPAAALAALDVALEHYAQRFDETD